MNRSLIIYALLLAGSLGFAYQTWTHEDELALADKVVMLPGSAEQLASVAYRSADIDVVVEFRDDDLGRFGWVNVDSHPTKKDEEEADDNPHAPPKPPEPVAEVQEFKLGKAGNVALESLAPFVAKRRLEGVTEEDMTSFGLDESAATLEITRDGKEPKRFDVGGQVFGGANVYVRDPDDGAVYLVEARVLRPLSNGAQTLADRDLSGVDERAVARITLSVGERQVSFAQHNPDDPEAKYWSVAGGDDKSPEATAWVGKVLRLRSSRYVQEGQEPADLTPAFSYTVHPDDGDPIAVEVLRSFDEDGQEQFFARSPHTRGLVQVPRGTAAEASADLELALSLGEG